MIKTIIFDLDGVLVDTKDLHYVALNEAIRQVAGERWIIKPEDHNTKLDGLPTRKKLHYLMIPLNTHDEICKRKQEITIRCIKNSVRSSNDLVEILKFIKSLGIKICCSSNAVKETVLCCLDSLKVTDFFDIIVGGNEVENAKPNPEMYWKCMKETDSTPQETIIVEDSYVGRTGVMNSGAHGLFINRPSELKLSLFKNELEKYHCTTMKYKDSNLNVLIPMAGLGSRFEQQKYTFPKPLIEVNGEPMIKVVVDSLNIEANYIYIVRKEHYEKYNLQYLLPLITPKCKIVQVDKVTEGAACTTLLAKNLIDNDNPLFIVNSDQYIEWDSSMFFQTMYNRKLDAGLLTFNSCHPKWSFAKLGPDNLVVEVAEKKPISNIASVGAYWYIKGSNYVTYAEHMIAKNIRVNNEFYVCPVLNEAISDGQKVGIYKVDKMMGLGTPEDLDLFLQWKREKNA